MIYKYINAYSKGRNFLKPELSLVEGK